MSGMSLQTRILWKKEINSRDYNQAQNKTVFITITV